MTELETCIEEAEDAIERAMIARADELHLKIMKEKDERKLMQDPKYRRLSIIGMMIAEES